MKPGQNPTRRNRNIGTAKQGHGRDNKLVIPESFPKMYWGTLTRYRAITRRIGAKNLTFIVERSRRDSFHACTVDDIAALLQHVPPVDLGDVDLIILRQPKRKEEILNGAWGRAAFFVEIGEHQGPAIILEAYSIRKPSRKPKSLDPDDQLELDRLREDGHSIVPKRRYHEITSTIDSIRATQLYRTLLHEIGHHVDYQRSGDRNWDRKTVKEKETFAHQYADSLRRQLAAKGVVPFDRILDTTSLQQDGLSIEDFGAKPLAANETY